MERIGIFGGTFDPLHVGHLSMAFDAYQELRLTKVLFVVAKEPWQKEGVTPAAIRHMMVHDSVARLWWAEASDIEIRREGLSYTIDTLRELSALDGPELFLLLGQDQFDNLHTWKDSQSIEGFATIHVMPRWLNLSSTTVRDRVREGRPNHYLIPDEAQSIIETFDLYRKT